VEEIRNERCFNRIDSKRQQQQTAQQQLQQAATSADRDSINRHRCLSAKAKLRS